jgi:hypothetical protein
MDKFLEITLNFKQNCDDMTSTFIATFRVSEETLHHARDWWVQAAKPTTKDLSDWIENHGGMLHRENGPAVIECAADGATAEAYYRLGKLHRSDGPAHIVHRADGAYFEGYYIDGKPHRSNGPAYIIRCPDGSVCEQYFTNGSFVKEVRPFSLATLPGVTIRRSPPAPPAP